MEQGLEIESVSNIKMLQACHDFAEAVIARRIAHDDPHLDSQVLSAQRRFVGTEGQWRWAIAEHPATTLVAATIAVAYASKFNAPVQLFI
jgi:hypothetical protein